MLTLSNVHYRYQQDWMIFDAKIAPGEIVAVLGPSGAGKSTLLSLIAGLIAPDSGEITIDGKPVTTTPAHQRPLSILFQEHNVFTHLSVFDNMAIGLSPSLKLTASQRDSIHQAAHAVGLNDYLPRLPGQLSGGQRQRIALGRSIARNQPLLLLDEPFSALDPALKKDMLALVKRTAQAQGTTVVMVTHHPEDAQAIASQFLYLDEGQVRLHRPIEALNHPPEMMQGYMGTADDSFWVASP
ncbi:MULTISPECIES: thiamine ABC transporter ATP-binding protein [Salinivibrio]|uniref:Thiamine ABC transporter, ATP-binding protein n=1 Tax=Salinivibrio kushneri TaxID=1908198 RepID=A0AB36JX58_9GAMM|nr:MULTISPECIES: thiamine ABC transporter ATP-binding protein [Salinivibrio]OOE39616.1 thiamine ABC transporter, ATP-binding protein [Salinivibrio kushneri]OOE44499.1 thiamine ABC transporter, ATP-binding protein [Salinivibrio kushneri]OOE46878.1 thiamine ABC transporter, ATP-binding protein [Salinivibrio kushneri]OOE53135.1 thiamine ABC transporter, ATP-binding protein [Salinivibrio kushneri]OOE55079.1 thiamine ABC transporter, ATP-binding protein [Salinivibrio kushneri]